MHHKLRCFLDYIVSYHLVVVNTLNEKSLMKFSPQKRRITTVLQRSDQESKKLGDKKRECLQPLSPQTLNFDLTLASPLAVGVTFTGSSAPTTGYLVHLTLVNSSRWSQLTLPSCSCFHH